MIVCRELSSTMVVCRELSSTFVVCRELSSTFVVCRKLPSIIVACEEFSSTRSFFFIHFCGVLRKVASHKYVQTRGLATFGELSYI